MDNDRIKGAAKVKGAIKGNGRQADRQPPDGNRRQGREGRRQGQRNVGEAKDKVRDALDKK